MNTLADEFDALTNGEFEDTAARKLADVEVVARNYVRNGKVWPGREKNVYVWLELANGKAVGWNENPSRGYSFPVITLKNGV